LPRQATRAFDPARPLWELWLLPGLPDRRVGAFLKLHHVLADGPAAMAAFGALLDQTADAPRPGCTAVDAGTLPVHR
jgi:diacylglycerol O-acyltransferase / wax synthase